MWRFHLNTIKKTLLHMHKKYYSGRVYVHIKHLALSLTEQSSVVMGKAEVLHE